MLQSVHMWQCQTRWLEYFMLMPFQSSKNIEGLQNVSDCRIPLALFKLHTKGNSSVEKRSGVQNCHKID
jgi:hypothetical protein